MIINGEFERICENAVVACFAIPLLEIVVSNTHTNE
jgi:hypothetical protein